VVVPGVEDAYVFGWLPDGQSYVLSGKEQGHKFHRGFVWNSSTNALRPITPEGSDREFAPTQGSQMLYRGPDRKWYAVSMSGGDPSAVPALQENDYLLQWGQDGHSVFLKEALSGAKLKISRVDLRTGARTVWKELVAPPGDRWVLQPQITPDGKSYAYTYHRDSGNLYRVEGLK
jgi:Tol biopolymer transport system component